MGKNKKYTNDQFIAQSYEEEIDEYELYRKRRISVIIIGIVCFIIIVVGTICAKGTTTIEIMGFKFQITMPWKKEKGESIFTVKTKKQVEQEEKEKTKDAVVCPQFAANVNFDDAKIGYQLNFANLAYDDKGYTFDLIISPFQGVNILSFKMEKVLLDGFPFDINVDLKNISSPITEKVRVNQTDLDKYNMLSFKEMKIFYTVENAIEKSFKIYQVGLLNSIVYDNTVQGLRKIYDFNNMVLSYYKKEVDKDNTYIYFHARNSEAKKKEINVKRLLINDKLYDCEDYQANIFYLSQDFFVLTIPKKDIKEVEKIQVSFFITTINEEDSHMNAIYQTTDFTMEY